MPFDAVCPALPDPSPLMIDSCIINVQVVDNSIKVVSFGGLFSRHHRSWNNASGSDAQRSYREPCGGPDTLNAWVLCGHSPEP
jgi:hypothetical protein